jgi:hypothetical protein
MSSMRRGLASSLIAWSLVSTPLWAAGDGAWQSAPAATQCSKVWVGQAAAMEEFLRSAPIARVENVPVGVTKPKRVFFDGDGPIKSAAWKPLRPGRQRGYFESYRAEIAAYELDKLLGLDMVPPYVEREIDGARGALSLWVENVHAWQVSSPVQGPDARAWNLEISRMKLFDRLIGNIDRNQGNLLYDGEYHLILIDHSRAFTTTRDLSSIAKLSSVDTALWERVLALDEATLQQALSRWLRGNEIRAILARRDLLRKEVDALVAARGEAVLLRN